jgi:hypothetical protein
MAISRRGLLAGVGAGAAGVAASGLTMRARASSDGPKYLITIGCFGGASMIDCFMPIDPAEAFVHEQRGTVLSHPVAQPNGSNIRCVDRNRPRQFLQDHAQDTIVLGTLASSVNHFVAQARSINGRDVFGGRTMMEAVAEVHGAGMALPNVNMGRGGYAAPGTDARLDPKFRAEVVTNPVTFPLATSGHEGLLPMSGEAAYDPAVRRAMIERTRALRDGALEDLSPFGQTFANSRKRRKLLGNRAGVERQAEAAGLYQKLFFVDDFGGVLPLDEYGLDGSKEKERVLDAFPDASPTSTSGIADDRLEGQAALAYLLLRTGASASVTLTEPGTDGFLAFDQSHGNHRSAQATHWDRVLKVASRLIGLLETAEYFDANGPTGTSLWDRSMIVFATEFGRDKWDTGNGFGTGHHLNNGLLVCSPLLRGNRSLGVPDPNNGFICGFDPIDGTPTPFDDVPAGEDPLFSDPRQPPAEEAVFGTLLHALDVEYDGQEVIGTMLKRSF